MPEREIGITKRSLGVIDFPGAYTFDSAAYVSLTHHCNVDAARRQKTFVAGTGAAGVAPGTALSTTPPLTLYNPQASGVALALVSASMGYISGTLGGGTLVLGANPALNQDAPTGGSALTVQCTYFGFTAGKGLAYQGATLAAAPTLIEPVFLLGAFVGTDVSVATLHHRWDGSFLVYPGTSASLQGIAGAGTTPLVLLSLMWEEVSL